MTPSRREQIEQAAIELSPGQMEIERQSFIAGAEWADKNPDDWAFTQLKRECEKAHDMLAVAVEALEKMASDKNEGGAEGYYGTCAAEALDKIEKMKEK